MEFLRKSLEGIADIRHPAIESLENQIALLSVPKGIEQDIQARVIKLGLNTPETPEEEETASRIENLMSEHHKLIQAENAAEVHRKQLEGQEKFIAGLVFQREQLKRTPVEQQVHAAF